MKKVQVGGGIKGRQTCLCSTRTGEQPESPLCTSEPCSNVFEHIAPVCCVLCSLQVVKMKTMQVISLTLLCALTASAQVLKFGKCPKPAVQANFDVTRVNAFIFKKNLCSKNMFAILPKCVKVLRFSCSTSVSGTRSRSCQQPSRKVSAALPPTASRALVSSESSTVSCCEYQSTCRVGKNRF